LRWLLLPFTLAALAPLIALRLSLALYGLALRRRTPQASTRAPERLYVPIGHIPAHPSAHAVEILDDHDPSEPGDPWAEYLADPAVIAHGRQHLERCLKLDPSRHDHS
jgi:hypothetical protein